MEPMATIEIGGVTATIHDNMTWTSDDPDLVDILNDAFGSNWAPANTLLHVPNRPITAALDAALAMDGKVTATNTPSAVAGRIF